MSIHFLSACICVWKSVVKRGCVHLFWETLSHWGSSLGWSSQQALGILPVPLQCCVSSVDHHAPCLPGCCESSDSHACVACAVLIVPSPLPWLPVYLVINFLRTVGETLARAAWPACVPCTSLLSDRLCPYSVYRLCTD